MVLNMFSEPNRLRIISVLFERDLTVTQITQVLDLKQANTSRHLARLYEVGLVDKEQNKKHVTYFLNKSYKANCQIIRPVLEAFRKYDVGIEDMNRLNNLKIETL